MPEKSEFFVIVLFRETVPILNSETRESGRDHVFGTYLDGVERRSGDGRVLGNVTSPSGEDSVDGGDAVGGCLDLDEHVGLHQPRRGHEEGRVRHSPRGRDNLTAATVDGLAGDDGVEDLELGVPYGLLAQGTFSGSPLESLDDRVLDGSKETLVHLGREGVVNEDIGP